MHVHHVGMLRSTASWAKVMREHLLALDQLGHGISTEQLVERDRYNDGFELADAIEAAPTKPDPGTDEAVTMTYLRPGRYADIDTDLPLVGFLAYEATYWPDDWVEAAKENLQLAVLDSSFSYRGLIASGFPERRATVIPHGYDPDLYYPSNDESDGPFRVLFVGTPSRRKGLDVFVRAVRSAFDPDDDVEIVLKVNPYDGEQLTWPYVISDWRERCVQLADDGYQVQTIFQSLTEPEIAELFRSADLLGLPTRGEGFGMPILEAMACGTAPLVTSWSGQLDFIDETAALLISEYDVVPASDQYLGTPPSSSSDAKMVEPNADEVATKLRWAYENQKEVAEMGQRARQSVEDMTWERVTRRLVETLRWKLFDEAASPLTK